MNIDPDEIRRLISKSKTVEAATKRPGRHVTTKAVDEMVKKNLSLEAACAKYGLTKVRVRDCLWKRGFKLTFGVVDASKMEDSLKREWTITNRVSSREAPWLQETLIEFFRTLLNNGIKHCGSPTLVGFLRVEGIRLSVSTMHKIWIKIQPEHFPEVDQRIFTTEKYL